MNQKNVLIFGGGVLLLFAIMAKRSTASTFNSPIQNASTAPGVSNEQLAISGGFAALNTLLNKLPGISGNYESDDIDGGTYIAPGVTAYDL